MQTRPYIWRTPSAYSPPSLSVIMKWIDRCNKTENQSKRKLKSAFATLDFQFSKWLHQENQQLFPENQNPQTM